MTTLNRSHTSKIKIAILIGQTNLGGSERQLYYFLKYSHKSIFDYHIIVLNNSDEYTYDEAIRQLGVTVWKFPVSCVGVWQRIRYLYLLLRQIKPDLIHSWSFYANPYASLVGSLARVPVRLGSERNEPRYTRDILCLPVWHRWLAYCSVSGLVVNSRLAAEQISTMGYRARNIHVIYNGVELPDLDVDFYDEIDLSVYGILSEHRVVATVGNVKKGKNHHMFVAAMARLLPQFPDVRCLIVGQAQDPNLFDELQQYIIRLNLADKIYLTGVRNDVPQLMGRLTLFCLSSCSEGLPNVVLEAMAAACPVVSTRVGDVPNVIRDGVDGLLVDSEDTNGFTNAIRYLLSNPDFARRMGELGRDKMEQRFSCTHMAKEIETVYYQALVAKMPSISNQIIRRLDKES